MKRFGGKHTRFFIKSFLLIGLILIAINAFSSFQWYYHIWDTMYYEEARDAYLMQFPQTREVALETNYLTTVTIGSKDFFSLPFAKVYINDMLVTDFRKGQVTLVVNDGDNIRIDTSYYDTNIDFEIVSTSMDIVHPFTGEEFSLFPQNNIIGIVKTKEPK